MLSPDEKAALEKGMRQVTLVWLAMLGAVALYVVVAMVFVGQLSGGASEITGLIRQVFILIGSGFLVAAYLMRGTMTGIPTGTPTVQTATAAERAVVRYNAAVLLSLGLAEAVAILGLVLFFIGKSFTDIYLFVGLSAAGMFYFRPRFEELEAIAQTMTQSRPGWPPTS